MEYKYRQKYPKKNGLPDWLSLETDVKTEFGDIVGHDHIKTALKTLITFSPNKILLSGAEGVGKSMMVRALANYASWPLLTLSIDPKRREDQKLRAKVNQWNRQRELDELDKDEYLSFDSSLHKRIAEAFKYAKLRAPCILSIDEVEWYASEKSVEQFYKQFNSLLKNDKVFVIASTRQKLDLLDPSLTSKLCYDRQFVLLPPSPRQQVTIMSNIFSKSDVTIGPVNLEWVSEFLGHGSTGKAIAEFCHQLLAKADDKKSKEISRQDFVDQLEETLGPVLERRLDSEMERRLAIYRAGQALICIERKQIPFRISLLDHYRCSRKGSNGKRDESICTKDWFEKRIAILYAGSLAEKLMTGQKSNLSLQDNKEIEKCLNEMHKSNMIDFLNGSCSSSIKHLPYCLQEQLHHYCKELEQNTLLLLEGNQTFLVTLTNALLVKKTLYPWDVEQLLTSSVPQ